MDRGRERKIGQSIAEIDFLQSSELLRKLFYFRRELHRSAHIQRRVVLQLPKGEIFANISSCQK